MSLSTNIVESDPPTLIASLFLEVSLLTRGVDRGERSTPSLASVLCLWHVKFVSTEIIDALGIDCYGGS